MNKTRCLLFGAAALLAAAGAQAQGVNALCGPSTIVINDENGQQTFAMKLPPAQRCNSGQAGPIVDTFFATLSIAEHMSGRYLLDPTPIVEMRFAEFERVVHKADRLDVPSSSTVTTTKQ